LTAVRNADSLATIVNCSRARDTPV
jgi:hypothetical protein